MGQTWWFARWDWSKEKQACFPYNGAAPTSTDCQLDFYLNATQDVRPRQAHIDLGLQASGTITFSQLPQHFRGCNFQAVFMAQLY